MMTMVMAGVDDDENDGDDIDGKRGDVDGRNGDDDDKLVVASQKSKNKLKKENC